MFKYIPILFLFGCALPACATTKVHEYKLDNGLKLIVKEDHRAPVVVSQVWYKVGSSYEQNGVTGVSHVLEHMMFKGTKNLAPGEFSRIVAENGGRENAFTSRDYTAYFQQLEKDRLEVSFKLESDRMQGLVLPQEEFEKEVKVVMEERRLRTEDNPEALTYERFNAAAFLSSPYRHPIIGWMNDLQNMKVEDLKDWYKKWYAPNNATVVVVGDVQPASVYELAKKYFGNLQPSEVGEVKPQHEPTPSGLIRTVVRTPAQLPYVILGYHVPSLKTAQHDWEVYALEVMAGVLDGGSSSRLDSRLVRGGIASSADAGYSLGDRLDTLFLLDGSPIPGKSIDEVEAALRHEIKNLKETLVEDSELARVKAQVIADNVYERDSTFYQAMQIGRLETVGLSWKIMDEYVDKVRAVTAKQIQSVAKKYLVEDRLTVTQLDPLPMDEKAARAQSVDGGAHGRH